MMAGVASPAAVGEFPWLEDRLVRAPDVSRLELGARRVLFCERDQKLFELNSTADTIWNSLAAGRSVEATAKALQAAGASAAEARSFAVATTTAWLHAGYLAPQAAWSAVRDGTLTEQLWLDIEGDITCLSFAASALAELGEGFASAFGQFATGPQAAASTLQIVPTGNCYALFAEGRPLGLRRPDQVTPEIKARLTDRLARSVADGDMLLHAALLSVQGRGLLISGPPGAGKSTLALVLAASGLAYGSDDMVKVSARRGVSGVGFSPALKAGSWDLVEPWAPKVASLTRHLRADGQAVRYAPATWFLRDKASDLRWTLTLDRRSDGPPRLEPVDPLDMLAELLSSGFSADHLLKSSTLDVLADALAASDCRRLIYSDLSSAVALVREWVGG